MPDANAQTVIDINARAGIGHNFGPSMEPGQSWRRFAWRKARAELLPTLPLEVVRRRVARAKQLGLPYKTYAGIRASTGRDLVGFLFSTNALRVHKAMLLPADRAARLAAIAEADRVALTRPPLLPALVAELGEVDAAYDGPIPLANWPQMQAQLRAVMADRGLPADGCIIIGETTEERLWSEAGRMAGFLSADQFFAQPPA
ncbi:MAG: hypothetical protein JKX69_11550 [Rhodobacteraceae bacterium]|nr:hypothetical protein [Paracoccaceae bacterium]